MKISQSSHKMYSITILNFLESTIILNACSEMSGNLLNAPRIYIYIYIYIFEECSRDNRIYIYIYIYIYSIVPTAFFKLLVWQTSAQPFYLSSKIYSMLGIRRNCIGWWDPISRVWCMWSTLSLALFSGILSSGEVVPISGSSVSQIELFNNLQRIQLR